MTQAASSPYLGPLHHPVSEELTAKLSVRGELPRELAGSFARNSGNPQFEPQGRYHWFDGDGMVHALELGDGQATYRNRWIRTAAFEREREAGRALWPGLLEPLQPGLDPPIKDTANTDLIWHNGQLLATWWLSGTPMALGLPELETRGPCTFGGKLPWQGCAAHPKVCPRTGELMFFGYSLFRRPYYVYGVVAPDGTLSHAVELDLPRAHVPHDIAITERYTILLDLPLGYDRAALQQGKKKIGFDRSVPARFGIVPRHGGAEQVRWFELPTCYVYHTINAYERGDEVVLTACRIEDPVPAGGLGEGGARLDSISLEPYLYRWTFNLATGEAKGEQLDDRVTEFPRANDLRLTYPLRYSYNPRVSAFNDLSFDGLIKYDLESGASTVHDYAPGWFGGEAVFAPRPGASGEDDGWVLSVLSHVDHPSSKLVVLDAQVLAAAPLAEVALPQRIPLGFHAAWVAA
ncbi:MAG: carotenoid oxygenase family protein, partial [Planctomycetes bacterium]|nr:carotenoid oxygenase family protein [Planctomycetota bacterium]